MTIGKPTKSLTWADLPKPSPGVARYSISPLTTRGYSVLAFAAEDGQRSTVEFQKTEQAAFRAAIRYQKRANANARKAVKGSRP